jgi:hypothetical protein
MRDFTSARPSPMSIVTALLSHLSSFAPSSGSNAPSTKQHVEFLYRIATRPPPRQNKSV